VWRLYKMGIGLTTGFIGSHTVTVYTLLQLLTVHYNTCRFFLQLQLTLTTESQLLLSFFRAQDLLQTQLALTGHQLPLQLSSHLRLTRNWNCPCNCTDRQSQSHIMTDDQSVSASWFRAPSGAHDQILITVWQLLFCRYRAPPLTRGRVCHLI
jgi:hypothetical protein